MSSHSDRDHGVLSFLSDVVVNAAVILVVVYTLQYFLVAPFQVVGNSMVNTLQDGELILVSRIGYYFDGPQHGDIIVFHPPNNRGEWYIKRVIGVPGDEVRISKGEVYVNGELLEEEYLRPGLATCLVAHMSSCNGDDTVWDVPEKKYFVLGDNRDGSTDSRVWYKGSDGSGSFVDEEQIAGKTKMVMYPLPSIRWMREW